METNKILQGRCRGEHYSDRAFDTMMNSGSEETICAYLNPCRRGEGCGPAARNDDKERVRERGPKISLKFTSFIHRPSAWHHCPTRATKEIKSTRICMWKVRGLYASRKPKSSDFKGYLTSIQTATKAWLSGWEPRFRLIGDGAREREREGGKGGVYDHRPHLFTLFTS